MSSRLAVVAVILALAACSATAHTPAANGPTFTSDPATTAPAPHPTTTKPVSLATSRAAVTTAPTSSRPRPTTRRPTATAPTTVPPPPPPVGTYAFPVRGCRTSYAHSHHDYPATDIFAPRGCDVIAPTAGRVDEVSRVDRWASSTNRGADRGGISWSVVGDDGVRYYGSHLTDLAAGIEPGVRVVAGTLIGHVGNTGDARGIATHLHFGLSWPTRPGIWWVRRGEVYPWPYLDSWRAGGERSPAAAVAAEHARQGDEPPCRVDC